MVMPRETGIFVRLPDESVDDNRIFVAVRRADRMTWWDVARLSDTDKETIGRALRAAASFPTTSSSRGHRVAGEHRRPDDGSCRHQRAQQPLRVSARACR